MARRVKDAASKRRQRQAWDLAVQIQRPDYRPSGAQYYHDRRISSSRFRRLFSRNLTEVVRTNRLTFYRINERRVK